MTRSVWTASAALAIVVTCNSSFSQTSSASIASFDDVAGKWIGHANRHSVTLEIDTGGRFTARYALGGEKGKAKLEGGTLVLPLPKHEGSLQLTKDGETLKGPGVVAGKTWLVSLRRSASP
jgi:hypothetical protein